MKRFNRILLGTLLTLTMLAFVGQIATAGPGCKGLKDGKKSCGVKACDAKATCAVTKKASSETTLACCADGKKCTKEDCLKKCIEMGMTQEQAEEMWAKHQQTGAGCASDGTKLTKEECINKYQNMGMTTEQAEACWTKHQQMGTTATATKASAMSGGCPMMAKANVTTTQACTKEQCVAKLMADGLSKEEAEAKYAACVAEGKCSTKSAGNLGCAGHGGRK